VRGWCNQTLGAGQEVVVADDRARFEELFTRHYAAVVRYALRRVGSEAAQEVVAEIFLVAWRRFSEVPDNALPWLYATARRLVANELRRRSRAVRLGERLESLSDGVVADHAEVVTDQLRMHAALAGLSEQDREVLRLAAWEQIDTADAAKVMRCSRAAFKVRLHRARRRLAAVLGAGEDVALAVLTKDGEPS
jgi:RNA polymerase sigma factor (sigma-70 family)